MASLKNLLVLGSARFVNTIKGTVEKAEKLLTARTIQTDLTSTSEASFDGSANITPGVTGTLPASSGGTGQTSAKNASNAFINALDTGNVTNVPIDSDYFVSQYIGGNGDNSGASNANKYYRRPLSQLWLWISTKLVTTTADGLMSSTDKIKLDGIAGQSTWYGTCATAAGTADKVVTTTSGDFILTTGSMVRVKFTNNDTYNGTSTLNVDNTGAINIARVGTSAKARYYWLAGEVVDFVYDGTNFTMLEGGVATTTYYGITKLSSATNSTSTALAATASAVKAAYDLATEAKEATEFGTVGSEATPIYFDDGVATPGFFTWGVNDDQNVQVGWDGDAPEIEIPTSSALPISSGGTGATTAADARTNLGLGSAATYNVVSTVNNDSNLVTGAAIKTYYEAVGIPSAISTTSAATAAKVATCSSYSLLANSYIQVIIATANSANSALTLNINGKGAKPIYINGSASGSSNKTLPAGSYFVFYNGTNYYFRTDGKLTGNITGDAATVNGHTVALDVPSTAKFTDTTALASMTGTLGADHGGTGQTSLQATRNAMGLGNTTGSLPIANGGTGGTTRFEARNNLGFYVIDAPAAGSVSQYGQLTVPNPAGNTSIILLTNSFLSGSTTYTISMESVTASTITLRIRNASDGSVLTSGTIGHLMIYKIS